MNEILPSKPLYRISILVILLLFFAYRGLIPAFTTIDTDFPNYYTAGRIALEGHSVDRLYDDAWFQEQIHSLGIHQQGKFSPFPPPTALLFIPLAVFSPLTSLRVLTIINLLAIAFSILLLARSCKTSFKDSMLLILVSGLGLVNCVRFGQLYILLSLSILVGYFLFTQGRPFLAGMAFGAPIPVKYFPAIFVAYFIWRREWRVVLGAMLAVFVFSLASIGVLGWQIHELFLRNVFVEHFQGNLAQQNPFVSTFQSFDALFRRLFVFNDRWNPAPLLDSPMLYQILKAATIVGLLAVVVYVVWRTRSATDIALSGCVFGLLAVFGLLIAPATATYHFILLWLPIGLLLFAFASWGRRVEFWFVFISYCVIGFIPYGFFRSFDGVGILTLLAYPRLFLLLTIFITSAVVIRSRVQERL